MTSAVLAPPAQRTGLLLGAYAAALALRVVVGGPGAAAHVPAALVFAAALVALTWSVGTPVTWGRRVWLTGLGGALVLCAPPAIVAVVRGQSLPGTAGLLRWTLVVLVVAGAEEAFLRGALHDAVAELAGTGWAVATSAAAFALLHVPLYGWHVLPLDLAVGVLLGLLRVRTGTFVAPAVAHVGADVGSWFLR